jgi:hypothetical protein
MARLPKCAETYIALAFLVMCAEKIRWLLRLSSYYLFLVLCFSKVRLPLDGAQELLVA